MKESLHPTYGESERMAVVGRFASSIVHDLKNSLTVITIVTDLAFDQNTTPESRESARRIRQQVERINALVNDILDFTRGGNTCPELELTNFAGFVTSIVQELQPNAALRSVDIKFENAPPLVELRLHPQRLGRAFHNLINNALEVMPYGGDINLRFQMTDHALITEIADSGPGIAPEIADRLFEPFASYGKVCGTGLGLFITKKIIEDHHGEISAHNKMGNGAVFSISLPLASFTTERTGISGWPSVGRMMAAI